MTITNFTFEILNAFFSTSNTIDLGGCCTRQWHPHPTVSTVQGYLPETVLCIQHSEESGFFQPGADFCDCRNGVVLTPDHNI